MFWQRQLKDYIDGESALKQRLQLLEYHAFVSATPRRIVEGELIRLDDDEIQEWFAIDQEFCYSPLSSIR